MNVDDARKRLADMASDCVIITRVGDGLEGLILWCNDALLAATGYERAEVIGAGPMLFHGPGTSAETVGRVRAAVGALQPIRVRLLNYRKDGTSFWIDLRTSLLRDDDGVPRFWASVMHDITADIEMEQRLAAARAEAHEARERLLAAIDAMPDGFVLHDADDRAILFNERYRRIYPASAAAIRPGARFEDVLRAGLRVGQYVEAIGREEEWLRERMAQHRAPDGPLEQELPGDRHVRVHEIRLPTGDTVGIRSDITVLKRQKRELEARARALDAAARTDPLTGLLNRRGLDLEIEAIRRGRRAGEMFAVLHIDLDRFKPVNDVFGHAAGDHLLREVAGILRASVRRGDLVARVGGDEFAVLLKSRMGSATGLNVAEEIAAACSAPVEWNGRPLHFGCSIGVAIGPREEIGDLLRHADIALYEAKEAGRGRAALFTPDVRRRIEERKQLSDEVLAGIERREFVAHYQPQVNATDRALAGAEALVRWNHPGRGLLQPSAFLQVAEELGVLSEIEDQVLDHATATVAELRDAGVPLPALSFNLGLMRLARLRDADEIGGYLRIPCRGASSCWRRSTWTTASRTWPGSWTRCARPASRWRSTISAAGARR
jgi:diguanylate cyclase (GGDEF)-like protein/PAS domain S-box-containing protein